MKKKNQHREEVDVNLDDIEGMDPERAGFIRGYLKAVMEE